MFTWLLKETFLNIKSWKLVTCLLFVFLMQKSFEETMDAINRKKAERLDSTQKEEDKKEM